MQDQNEILYIIAITVAMLVVIAFSSVYVFFLFQKRKIKFLQNEKLLKEQYEQEILRTQIEIRDKVMDDVSKELHDHISQVLTLAKLNISLLANNGLDEINEKRLHDTKVLLKETIDNIRSLSKTLNGDLIQEIGLVASIEQELHRINNLKTIHCELKIIGEEYDIPANSAFIILRIMQENLHNILKHAKCTSIVTTLEFNTASIICTQQDNGVGFEIEKIKNNPNRGNGMLNMQRRANMANAKLSITSELDIGTVLRIELNN